TRNQWNAGECPPGPHGQVLSDGDSSCPGAGHGSSSELRPQFPPAPAPAPAPCLPAPVLLPVPVPGFGFPASAFRLHLHLQLQLLLRLQFCLRFQCAAPVTVQEQARVRRDPRVGPSTPQLSTRRSDQAFHQPSRPPAPATIPVPPPPPATVPVPAPAVMVP